MDIYQDRKLVKHAIGKCLTVYFFIAYYLYLVWKDGGVGSNGIFSGIMTVVIVLILSLVSFSVVQNLMWLLKKQPSLSINRHEVVVRVHPWKEVRLSPSKQLSFHLEREERIVNKRVEYKEFLVIKGQNQPKLKLNTATLDQSVDTIYEAVSKYVPTAEWHD